MEKANIVSIRKKNDKQLLENYRAVLLLLPIYAKVFEITIYNTIFEYLISNF